MLFISKLLFDRLSIFKSQEQVKEGNWAPIIAFVGYLLGITFVLAGAYVGPAATSFKLDLVLYIAYAVLGIALMSVSGVVIDKIMLSKLDCKKELLEDKNIGTAAVYFGTYVAVGLIAAACVNGEYGGLLSSIVYYIAGLFFIGLFIKFYNLKTPYCIHDELEKDNYAVGIALAGNIIAMGIILMKATLGDMTSVKVNIAVYFADLAAIFLLLPAARFVLGNIIVRHVNLSSEIKNGNVAAGLLEFASIICFAIIIFFMVDFEGAVFSLYAKLTALL
jgi:uncharacterized membrane protein YjfL (UPF0719 family)